MKAACDGAISNSRYIIRDGHTIEVKVCYNDQCIKSTNDNNVPDPDSRVGALCYNNSLAYLSKTPRPNPKDQAWNKFLLGLMVTACRGFDVNDGLKNNNWLESIWLRRQTCYDSAMEKANIPDVTRIRQKCPAAMDQTCSEQVDREIIKLNSSWATSQNQPVKRTAP